MLYRASDSDIANKETYVATIGYARLTLDGRVIEDTNAPVLAPETAEEQMGCEDPRIVRFEDRIYVFYTAFSGDVTRVGVAVTADFRSFDRLGYIDNGLWDKDAFIFPKRTNGRVAYMHRIEPSIQVEYADSVEALLDRSFWDGYEERRGAATIMERREPWEEQKIGAGPPPIETDAGWLLIFHGATYDYHYRAGAALLDKDDPRRVIARLPYPILEPETDYEKHGDVPNVVFPEGAFVEGDTLHVYYGAADTHIGYATVSLRSLIEELLTYRL